MIQVPKPRLHRVEYLIEQSVQGNHVLFDPDDLRRVLSRARARGFSLSAEDAYETEPYIERLLEQESLQASRAYLSRLTRDEYERVLLTYLCIVENALYDSTEARH
jgi:hypothetical protein